jgi:hypothetical protein
MLTLIKLILGLLPDLFRSRAALEAEILVLRQQIIVLRWRKPAARTCARDLVVVWGAISLILVHGDRRCAAGARLKLQRGLSSAMHLKRELFVAHIERAD